MISLGSIYTSYGAGSFGSDIKDAGAVVGYTHVNATDPPHAFVYRNGVMTDLGTGFGAGSGSFAAGINNTGHIVGRLDLHASVLTGQARQTAFAHTAQLVAPGGRLLVIAGARHEDDEPGDMPWPLTRSEIEQFTAYGLTVSSIAEVVDDESRGPIRRWTAWFDRSPRLDILQSSVE